MATHRNTGTTPLDLVLSCPAPDFTLDHSARRQLAPSQDDREDYARRLDLSIHNATASLRRSQERYKRDFDARLHKTRGFKVGEAALLDVINPSQNTYKFSHNVAGPNNILDSKRGTALIQRDELT